MEKSSAESKITFRAIRRFSVSVAFFFQLYSAFSQPISGIVISKIDKKPLVGVNIGVFHKPVGDTTDETGSFCLSSPHISQNDSIRISMIGFKSQTFAVRDIRENKIFTLEEDVVILQEVIIQNTVFKLKEIGTKTSSKNIVTGWARHGMGGERGLKIRFKKYPVQIEELNFFIANNGYDSIALRLHIRSIKNNLPNKEILTQNIIIPVKIKSGWVITNLDEYNLMLDQDVAVTLEWLNAWGKCQGNECLLFSLSIFEGTLYAKEASEDNWLCKKGKSPGIYLKIKY